MAKSQAEIEQSFEKYECFKLFDFSVGDGWLGIVYDILHTLSRISASFIDKNTGALRITHIDGTDTELTLLHTIDIVQIKEKFGGLRFYYHYKEQYNLDSFDKGMISGIVRMAEAIASKTCEYCGEPGKLECIGGCYTTCCENHKIMMENGQRP